MGKDSKTPKKTWVEYYLSMHLGFCHGPVDHLTSVWFNEKQGWTGEVFDNGPQTISAPELFGGNEKEGGVGGVMHVMLGSDDQLAPNELAARLSKTPETMPGFRGLASLFFCGAGLGQGFLCGTNYPNVPPIWARIGRGSYTLSAPNPTFMNSMGTTDANPAHMLHELLVNDVWGMGGREDSLDTDSFVYAAQILSDEQFGLSMLWTKQSTIEAFAQEILDHINGMFFFNPLTGKGVLKLLRDDYDPDALPAIGPDNAVLRSFRRKLWGETINEVVIQWTNPQTEEQETLTYQDLANIAMQGEVVSQTSNYYGIRSPELAAFVGARDIVSQSLPLATAQITVSRRLWTLLPGDVVRFSWPKHNINNVIMRVMEVDYGTLSTSEIKVTLLEDVFGLPLAKVLAPPKSEWKPPEQDPNVPGYQPEVIYTAIPYPVVVQTVGSSAADDEAYPQILIAPLVTPKGDQTDLMSYKLWDRGVLPDGTETWRENGEKTLTGRTTLTAGLVQEVESIMTFDKDAILGRSIAQQGGLAIIFDPLLDYPPNTPGYMEHIAEWVMFLEDLGGGSWRVARGIFDTIPHNWAIGAKVWFIDFSWRSTDTSPEIAYSTTRYKIQPRTALGPRDLDQVPEDQTIRPARPYMPFRPANVHVDGVMFGSVDHSQNHVPRDWTLETAWSTRHRKMEDRIYRRWNEPDVPPEDGQVTEIVIKLSDDLPLRRIAGLTGDTYGLPIEETGQVHSFSTKFLSKRDDFESLQGLEVGVTLYPKGFGCDWGYFYGGWPEEFTAGLEEEN